MSPYMADWIVGLFAAIFNFIAALFKSRKKDDKLPMNL